MRDFAGRPRFAYRNSVPVAGREGRARPLITTTTPFFTVTITYRARNHGDDLACRDGPWYELSISMQGR